jgi:hypothetical protein
MPIIRSSRVLYKWFLPVVFGAVRSAIKIHLLHLLAFYFHILSTMHGQSHIKYKNLLAKMGSHFLQLNTRHN